MSLSINQAKINEQLARNPPKYSVVPCNLEIVFPPIPEKPPTVSSTVDASREWEEYRDRVLALRQRIIQRGKHPAGSAYELERIIDETRGRS